MRWILSGESFGAAEAFRIGLVQEVVPHGRQHERGLALARRVASQAPLAVQATLANAKLALRDGEAVAASRLQGELVRLLGTEDSKRGLQAFLDRTEANFLGE